MIEEKGRLSDEEIDQSWSIVPRNRSPETVSGIFDFLHARVKRKLIRTMRRHRCISKLGLEKRIPSQRKM